MGFANDTVISICGKAVGYIVYGFRQTIEDIRYLKREKDYINICRHDYFFNSLAIFTDIKIIIPHYCNFF